MRVAHERIVVCTTCGNVDTRDPCTICADARRDRATLVVVESVGDLWALERADATARALPCARRHAVAARRRRPGRSQSRRAWSARVGEGGVKEVILAVNATVDGQTTAHYITDLLSAYPVKVTRLAHGVPVGGELDYLDDGTLAAAMRQRTVF